MGENLFVGSHKSGNKKFDKGYVDTFGERDDIGRNLADKGGINGDDRTSEQTEEGADSLATDE